MSNAVTVNFHESVVNEAYKQYLDDFRFFQIFKGGGSAGKSVFVSQKIILKMMELLRYNGMVIRKHNADNHDSTFSQIVQTINEFDVGNLFDINRSKGGESVTCCNGSKAIFKGLDNVEKRKSVTFETGPLVWIWIEEATEISEDDLNQLIIRLRGNSDIPKHIYLSFNPIDVDHWLKKRFFDTKLDPKDGYICETTYLDNDFLTEQDIRNLEKWKDIDNYYYMVYVLNQWGSINTARVLHNIEIHNFDYDENTLENVCYGMDFGFIHASTLMSIGFHDDELYIFNELYAKEKTNTEWIKHIESTDWNKRNLITADNVEPARIKEFKQAGFNITEALKGKDSLKSGVDYLRSKKIHIHKTKCPNAAREFPRFKYRELKDGTITEEFVEIDDDTIAGARYGTEHIWSRRKGIVKPSKVNIRRLGL